MALTRWLVILDVIFCLFPFTFANRTATEQLYQTLLTGYNPYVRPNSDQTDQTRAVVTLHLLSISGLDELSGTMSTVVYVDITWTDSRMVWNTTEYGNIKQILFPQKLVWKPDLVVTNPVKKVRKIGFDDIMIRYRNDGVALWYTGDYLETSCDIDVTHFPFDRQLCKIEMIPWNYRHRELQLLIARNDINLDNFTQNGEWILTDTTAERVGDGPFEYVYFKLYLQRRSSFFIVNLFIPVVLLVLLNSMVFVLSADSGERVGYAITCLLSMTVYLTLVSDTIPKTSKPISVLSFVLMILLILSAFICFLTIIGLKFHFRKEDKPLPSWLIKLIRVLRCKKFKKCRWSGRIDNSKTNTRQTSLQIDINRSKQYSQQTDNSKSAVSLVENSDDGSKSGVHKKSLREDEDSKVINEDYKGEDIPEYDVETWKTFAKLFDKYCFILCVCTVIVLAALYILISLGRLSLKGK
jgi:cation transporter family protein